MDNIYREEILEHYKYPSHFGVLTEGSISSKLTNPFCGDEIEVFIQKENGKIQQISFTGKGCAISIAATSMLMETAEGKKIKDMETFTQDAMLDLLDIPISQTRKKCALLGWSTLQDILLQIKQEKSNTI